MSSPTVKLSSGHQMPLVGYVRNMVFMFLSANHCYRFGLWKVNNDTCADQVYNAIKTGYRLLDGACDYGNETECGEGVARAIKDGLVKREDLFIVSKLWNSFHDKERVEPICKKQLQDWGINYFDLYLIHFPISLKYVDPSTRYPPGVFYDHENVVPGNATIQETWEGMEGVAQKGFAKSIGISNFNAQLLMDLLRYAKVKPATLQIEHHPYLTQEGLVQYAKSQGLHITAYSSFGPSSYHELDMKVAKDTPLLLQHTTVKKIADKHGKTSAQILLRWSTQRGIAVIPKSNNQDRLAQNLDVTSFDLSQTELDEINGLNKNLRFNDPVNVSLPRLIYFVVANFASVWLPSTYLRLSNLQRACYSEDNDEAQPHMIGAVAGLMLSRLSDRTWWKLMMAAS
jgi:D-xylose reductase